MSRLENLLAAQALALTDRITADESGRLPAASERAALVTLVAHPQASVSWLGGVLGLTSSGITRLVDRVEAAGWVKRSPGVDARSRRLRLTAGGRRQAERVLAARRSAMAEVIGRLPDKDQIELERILGVLLAGLAEDQSAAMRVCRLCDRTACASGSARCPLGQTVPAS